MIGKAPNYTPITTATTLTTDAEISTGTGGSVVTVISGTSVTFVPAATTSPTVSVTVGTPPSRQRVLPLILF